MPRGIPKSGKRASRPAPKSAFKKGDDPRRNTSGQRNAEVVKTAAQYRDYLVEMLHRPTDAPKPETVTYLALMAHNHVKAAAEGDSDEREKLLDRIWGKSAQPIDLSSSDGSMTPAPAAVMFIPYDGIAPNTKPDAKTDVSRDTDSPEVGAGS